MSGQATLVGGEPTYLRSRTWRRTSPFALLLLVLASVLWAPASASAATARSAVWVGSPIAGNWPGAEYCSGATYPSDWCSLPFAHHSFTWGMPYVGDWAADLTTGGASGQQVRVFAAPNETWRTITAKVEKVMLACAPRSGESYEGTRSRGGNTVVVGMYEGATRIGWVSYVHVDPWVSQGNPISRWGGVVGTVGRYVSNSCWTGPHSHVELTNESNYACYNRGWQPGQPMNPSNFIGFLGGNYAGGPRQPCP